MVTLRRILRVSDRFVNTCDEIKLPLWSLCFYLASCCDLATISRYSYRFSLYGAEYDRRRLERNRYLTPLFAVGVGDRDGRVRISVRHPATLRPLGCMLDGVNAIGHRRPFVGLVRRAPDGSRSKEEKTRLAIRRRLASNCASGNSRKKESESGGTDRTVGLAGLQHGAGNRYGRCLRRR